MLSIARSIYSTPKPLANQKVAAYSIDKVARKIRVFKELQHQQLTVKQLARILDCHDAVIRVIIDELVASDSVRRIVAKDLTVSYKAR